MAELKAFCHFISGKLASVDGPRRDKCGRIVYGLVVGGQIQKRRRDYTAARNLAESHNAKVRAMARHQAKFLIAEMVAEMNFAEGSGPFTPGNIPDPASRS